MPCARWLFIAWAVIVVAAISLSVAAARHDRFAGELAVARNIQGWPEPAGALSEAIRTVTTTEIAVLAGAVLAAMLLALKRPRAALSMALLFAALPWLQRGVKMVVDRPRPGELLDMRGSATSESFPSGHVMSGTVQFAALIATAWLLPLPRPVQLTVTCVLVAATVIGGLANVYEGVHWPSDVAGGYLWASVLLVPFAMALARWRDRVRRTPGDSAR